SLAVRLYTREHPFNVLSSLYPQSRISKSGGQYFKDCNLFPEQYKYLIPAGQPSRLMRLFLWQSKYVSVGQCNHLKQVILLSLIEIVLRLDECISMRLIKQ